MYIKNNNTYKYKLFFEDYFSHNSKVKYFNEIKEIKRYLKYLYTIINKKEVFEFVAYRENFNTMFCEYKEDFVYNKPKTFADNSIIFNNDYSDSLNKAMNKLEENGIIIFAIKFKESFCEIVIDSNNYNIEE